MIAIIPILIKVAAGALTKGSTKVIAKWAGGSIAKKYIATKVADKVINEAQKMASGESKDWQAAFKESPANALRDAAKDFVKAEIKDASVNEDLIQYYNDRLINNTGETVNRESRSTVTNPENFILRIDPEKIIDRTNSDIISRGLEWDQNRSGTGGGRSLDRNVIGGSSPIASRQVLEQVNQIESVDRITTSDILESAGKTAFYDSFDERNLTYTIIGTDDALAGRVRSPLEALMAKTFDIDEPASL